MNIQIISDLHVDFEQNRRYLHKLYNKYDFSAIDVLIIAGDICPHGYPVSCKLWDETLNIFLKNCKRTIVIPGNHDFWGCGSGDPSLQEVLNIYHYNDNILYYANNNVIVIGGVSFLCSTLWSKITCNPVLVFNGMNDYREITGLTIEKCNDIFYSSLSWLECHLFELDSCVVITHHLPSFNFISFNRRNDSLNEAFASNLDNLIMEYSYKIPLWVHGHSHDFFDLKVLNTRFIRNPFCYPHERAYQVFKDSFVVEI